MGAAGRLPVVMVPVYGRIALATRCLDALHATLPPEVELVVVDDVGPEPVPATLLPDHVGARVHSLVRHEHNEGFVRSVNDVLARRPLDDVVVVNSDVLVLPGWWDGLLAAVAAGGDRTASVTALANRGGVLSVPVIGALYRAGPPVDLAAALAVLPAAQQFPVAVGHCVLLRRAAIDDVGVLDETFSPGYGEEVDWSMRARRRGWVHLFAPRSLVLHGEGSSFGARRVALRRPHEVLLLRRYPLQVLALRVRMRGPGAWRRVLVRVAEVISGLVETDVTS